MGVSPPSRPAGESCPLCSAPLAWNQEWCLRCGAAARTRLAATPNWKTPVAIISVVAALALGVLAAALVKLAGDSGPPPTPSTATVTTAAAASTAAPETLTVPSTATATTPASGVTPTTATSGSSTATTPAGGATTSTAGAAGGTAAP
jgi:hypothetical protein